MKKPTLLLLTLGVTVALSSTAWADPQLEAELAAKRANLAAENAASNGGAAPAGRRIIGTKDIEVIAGTTAGEPTWVRPDAGFTSASGGSEPYVVQPFVLTANDNCTLGLDGGFDPFLFIYENSFDPLDQLTNGVAGDDDSGVGLNSLIGPIALTAGTPYFAIATAFSGGSGPFTLTINCPVANVVPNGGGVYLSAAGSSSPVRIAEELIIPPDRAIVNTGRLNVSTPIGYAFSDGEVRYARVHCPGVEFTSAAVVDFTGDPSNTIGAVNGIGSDAIYFSITAGATPVVASDIFSVDGDRTITVEAPSDCTYGLYDFPSQAQAGGPTGRVATTSGQYVRFAPSYALAVDSQGGGVANVESADPAYSEFVVAPPTSDANLAQIGGFSYGLARDVIGGAQPNTLDGLQIELTDLMAAGTSLVFAGDFETASDVFFSPNSDCSTNIQSADDFDATEATFTIGSNATLDHFLCFEAGGDPIRASEYTVSLDAVSADPAVYAVGDRGPLALGEITRNGAQLQAPLAQVPAGYISRMVLTNTGSQARDYVVEVLGETGNVISTANLTGTIPANKTLVVDLNTVLTGFTAAPRATLNVTVSGPNGQIQGLYQIVNPNAGSVSNHVMVRPGTN